jgi:hypothetical protein
MERKPQTLHNHAKVDPPFHLFIGPVFLVTWIISVVMLIRHPGFLSAWAVVFMTAAVVAIFRIRQYALKVQDRVIRLEERLRLTSLLPESLTAKISDLNESQIIALRFACDLEVAALTQKALAENLSNADIKKAVVTWRPDYWRV